MLFLSCKSSNANITYYVLVATINAGTPAMGERL